MSKKLDRVGETNTMFNGMEAKIIRYRNTNDLDIVFSDGYEVNNISYGCFKSGNVKNPYVTKVCGVGICDKSADSNIYKTWHHMLMRCYDEKYKTPTYSECKVCEEWKIYSNFENWYLCNYYEIEGQKMNLDKDILIKGNKLYSPNTCVFVPQEINMLFVKRNSKRGNCPIGVNYRKNNNKYEANVSKGSIRQYLGQFNTPEEAFKVYKKEKENYIKNVADLYKGRIPVTLYNAMYKYEVEITD